MPAGQGGHGLHSAQFGHIVAPMSALDKDSEPKPLIAAKTSPWRSSLYDEPTWVSLAWIVLPVGLAALGIFLAMR
jgi:hypothetical protein